MRGSSARQRATGTDYRSAVFLPAWETLVVAGTRAVLSGTARADASSARSKSDRENKEGACGLSSPRLLLQLVFLGPNRGRDTNIPSRGIGCGSGGRYGRISLPHGTSTALPQVASRCERVNVPLGSAVNAGPAARPWATATCRPPTGARGERGSSPRRLHAGPPPAAPRPLNILVYSPLPVCARPHSIHMTPQHFA